MVIIYFVIFIFAVIISLALYKVSTDKKNKNISKDVFNSLKDFSATELYLSETSGFSIGYDSDRKKICLLNTEHQAIIYSYDDILQSELNIDGKVVSKKSTSGVIGRSVLGGLLAGGAGAIIGGLSTTDKQNEKIRRIDLKLSINDSKNPFYKINFLKMELDKDAPYYDTIILKAERWQGIISTLIQQANNIDKNEVKEVISTTSDELIKLKTLLDSGVLTQKEFNSQKEKVLNN